MDDRYKTSQINQWRFLVPQELRPVVDDVMADLGLNSPKNAVLYIISDWLRHQASQDKVA